MKSEAPQIHSVAPSHGLGVWRDVVVFVWRKGIDRAAAERYVGLLAQTAAKSSAGVTGINLIEPAATLPDDDLRKLIALGTAKAAKILCGATVAEGEGFRASVVRAVTTGIAMLTRKSFPLKTFSRVPEAAGWVVENRQRAGALAMTPEELAAAIEAVRGQIPAR
jgi:hypothetical protein